MAVITGTNGVDTLTGTLGDDTIDALGGNDLINASQGADVVNGGAGTLDRLVVTAANAALFAQPTASRTYTITPSLVSDSSGTLNTSITGIERLTLNLVGSGDFGDTVNAGTFAQPLDIRLGNGSNNVTAGTGLDIITTGRGNDIVNGLAGNDTINASQGADQIDGGTGAFDRVFVTMSNAALFAAATGSRTYTITSTKITDSSGTLNTTFTGIESVSLSTVGAGNFGDTVDASAFAPAAGATAPVFSLTLLLGAGNDVLTGSAYNDDIRTGLGTSVVDAGAGSDVVAVTADTTDGATVFVTNSGGATITTQNGVQTNSILNAETIRVGGLVGNPTRIDASAYVAPAGTIFYFSDTNGTDIFIGGIGSEIFGNTTYNVLGNDVFTGGGGADSYDYVFSVGSMDGDTITDFSSDDNIDFTFNDPSVGAPDRADKFIGNAAFSNIAGEYRYQISGAQTLVQADTNGDGIADETLTISNGAFALQETEAGSNILVIAGAASLVAGRVSDGYVEGATLFIDVDGDKVRDPGEAFTVTGPNGAFSLNTNQSGTLVAVGGTNEDTGLPNLMTLSAPAGSTIVNPLTTVVQALVENGLGVEAAEDQVKLALGLQAIPDLRTYDMFASSDALAIDAQKASATIATLIATAEASAGAAVEAAVLDALADLVASATGEINFADAGVPGDPGPIGDILTAALPGFAGLAELIAEATADAVAISNAADSAGISAVQSAALLSGSSLDNTIQGGELGDRFRVFQGGTDNVSGLAGDDAFLFGGSLTADDVVSGGTGSDTLVVQGDYSSGLILTGNVTGIESISMLAGSNTNFGEPGTNRYDYSITTHDANFSAGVRARINGAALQAGEDFTFNGAAETDASFLVYGGRGKDTLTGGEGNDIFFFAEERFATGDTVDGGAGYDGMFLRGNYTIDFNAPGYTGLLTNVENMTLTSATDERYARGGGTEFDYNITLSDAIVKPGETLTINGSLLRASETMIIDASQESDGQLRLFGGAAADSLTGGGQSDLLFGNLGADNLTGGGGADVFRYQSATESTAAALDQIRDFASGTDKIDLTRIDASTTVDGDQAFSWIGSNAFSGQAGQLRAYQDGGSWFVEGDVNGDSMADLVIQLTNPALPPSQTDFFL
jgi:Ca2+-binding RTX toxin-like protein